MTACLKHWVWQNQDRSQGSQVVWSLANTRSTSWLGRGNEHPSSLKISSFLFGPSQRALRSKQRSWSIPSLPWWLSLEAPSAFSWDSPSWPCGTKYPSLDIVLGLARTLLLEQQQTKQFQLNCIALQTTRIDRRCQHLDNYELVKLWLKGTAELRQ